MGNDFSNIILLPSQALGILNDLYNIDGNLTHLNGEVELNYKVSTQNKNFLLKISRPDADLDSILFQTDLLKHLESKGKELIIPQIVRDKNQKSISSAIDHLGNRRYVRLFKWIDGRIYSSVNPKTDELLFSLGEIAGSVTNSLISFNHPYAQRKFEWDIAQAIWVKNHLSNFNQTERKLIEYFLLLFGENIDVYNTFRKSVVHSDVNDNNVVVTENLKNPKVKSIIDYGDAVFTQTINDLAICIAYGIMEKADVLAAAIPIIKGYHKKFPILEEELNLLYVLIAMRLVISVTKSALNKENEPENEYLIISESNAWDVLTKLREVNKDFATYSFRDACGFIPQPSEHHFNQWAKKINASFNDLFPTLKDHQLQKIDLSISSEIIGDESEYSNIELLSQKFKVYSLNYKNKILAGGYSECRPFYISDAYKKEGNNGLEFRTVHLGVDFWVEPGTPVHSLLDGIVHSVYNNSNYNDYGPTIILKHPFGDNLHFFTLFGHLSKNSLNIVKEGAHIKKGDQLGFVGNFNENGNWVPHLHYQIILDMLNNENDFPGVAFPKEINVWKSVCPNPNLIFKDSNLNIERDNSSSKILAVRGKHLGKSLSLSYNNPLHIVRGRGAYLIDVNGRKYLDTVNNVAHVGHVHPEVVKAGQEQMAVLNTNTRYLHQNITDFAMELLSTFPEKLSIVHFVNSGSEANELALRMARNHANQKDMIAIEVGYHGNTSGCIDVSSYKFDGKGGRGAPEYTQIVPLPDSYRGKYRGENSGQKYADHVKEIIENIKSDGRNIAGFICESIVSCGGQIVLPRDYLKLAFEYVRNEGGVCIADEVQVGLGRVGSKFWGFELYDVIPDIVTIGKPLGNGHPIAAVVCTTEIAESFNNGMEYFNTFGGNPVSCAIGRKVLDIIKREKLQQNALNVGNYLKNGLTHLQKDFPIIGDVRGCGLFLGFELVNNKMNPETDKANYLINRMKELGILMSTDGKANNVIKIKPPLVFTKTDADEVLIKLEQVLKEDFMFTKF